MCFAFVFKKIKFYYKLLLGSTLTCVQFRLNLGLSYNALIHCICRTIASIAYLELGLNLELELESASTTQTLLQNLQ